MPFTDAKPNQVLLCRCAQARVIPEVEWQERLDGLVGDGHNVLVCEDLCGLAARKDPALGEFLGGSPLVVAACHPRAVAGLLHFSGFPWDPGSLRILDLRTPVPEGHTSLEPHPAADTRGIVTPLAEPGDWIPWYPVIDSDRCVNCRQCRSFCLFGVYGDEEADGQVAVRQPRNCKTNCPACARICPEWAIIFPKFGEPAINGGVVDPSELAAIRNRYKMELLGDQGLAEALAKRRSMRRRLLAQAGAAGTVPPPAAPGEVPAREERP